MPELEEIVETTELVLVLETIELELEDVELKVV